VILAGLSAGFPEYDQPLRSARSEISAPNQAQREEGGMAAGCWLKIGFLPADAMRALPCSVPRRGQLWLKISGILTNCPISDEEMIAWY